jgi:hypothetical protein
VANHQMKDWEIIADNLSKAGWSWGCVSAINANGQTIFVADAHPDDGRRVVRLLAAFLELEAVIRAESDSLRRIASQQPGAASVKSEKRVSG